MINEAHWRLHDPVPIKRYAGRRLYNTATATYMSPDDLRQMVRQGIRFTVREAETGADITRAILDSLQ
jgi:polyhydroxyalkanoate synthesis repressor PhaR